MLTFPVPMPFVFDSETAAAVCAIAAIEAAEQYCSSDAGSLLLAELESGPADDRTGALIDELENVAHKHREEFGKDVEVIHVGGGSHSLYHPTFMDSVLLGLEQARDAVSWLANAGDEVDARVVAGHLAFENSTSFEDSLIGVRSLALAERL